MADSIHSVNIPVGVFPLVAGYVNGPISVWSAADWARHAGHSLLVRITVFADRTGLDVHVLDVENGDATPQQAPSWATAQRALGAHPTIYCSEAAWPSVIAAFNRAEVAQPLYVVAAYPGERDVTGSPLIPVGAIGHQFVDHGPYDESVVADYWPGVDRGGKVMAVLDQVDAQLVASAVITALFNTRVAGPDGASRSLFDSAFQDLATEMKIDKDVLATTAAVTAAQTEADARCGWRAAALSK